MSDLINQGYIGLNTDSIPSQLREGMLTFAMNALVENFDGNEVTYQNEQGNFIKVNLPGSYVCIGVFSIPQINRVLFWLTNPNTGNSQIGYVDNHSSDYVVLIDDSNQSQKLGFSVDSPIRKAVVKTTNCSTQVYWPDNVGRRYIDFDDLPWQEEVDPNNPARKIPIVGQLDINKLLVQPNFSIPKITPLSSPTGGILKAGTYQFAVQYSNSIGEGYTSYYSVTNPFPISEDVQTQNFDYQTGRAISIKVENLDTSGLFDYFNIAVVKTINGASTVELIGTFPTISPTYEYTYTGTDVTATRLDITEIFEKFPYYDIAGDVFATDNIIGWAILESEEDINYQRIWLDTKLQWETYQIPYNEFEGYKDGTNTARYRGYMRDEVYAFEGCFILKNGKQTQSFHIPGRQPLPFDLEDVSTIPDKGLSGGRIENPDTIAISENPCDDTRKTLRWEVYNTGTVIGKTEEFNNKTVGEDCYVGPYEYGEMAYWQSEENYPANTDIWGSRAGQPILHNKFPDNLISPIHSLNRYWGIADEPNYKTEQYFIYPIGVRVDVDSLYAAIQNSGLTQEQKDQIVGFKIVRGNRTTNKSVVAKGLMNNVGYSRFNSQDFLYPNYPFNDLRPDPFYTFEKIEDHSGYLPDKSLDGFNRFNFDNRTTSRNKYTFHSPDTSFYQPSLIADGLYLKMETVPYGRSYGHFIQVTDNAEYKFLTRQTAYASAALGIAAAANDIGTAASTYISSLELFDKLVPYRNLGYTFNSTGLYGNFYSIPNEGFKNRRISNIQYVRDGFTAVGTGVLNSSQEESSVVLNNFNREGAVYISTDQAFLLADEYHPTIPTDTSRYTLSSKEEEDLFQRFVDTPGRDAMLTDYVNQVLPGAIVPPYNQGVKYFIVLIKTRDDIRKATLGIAPFTNNTPYSGLAAILFLRSFYLYLNDNFRSPEEEREAEVSGYYGSVKRYLPSQWGQMYSYETIDTGYYHELYTTTGDKYSRFPAVFGGDIFINRFAYKSKMPFFRNNTVGTRYQNQTDISYDEIGNVNFPMFWISTKPIRFEVDIAEEVANIADNIINPTFFGTLVNFLTGGAVINAQALKLFKNLFREIYEKLGVKNINLDNLVTEGLSETGMMYLFAYGIPYFFVESEVNVDYRQAYNNKEGDFYPRAGELIPDNWLQEVNVSIQQDNTYTYNQTYSKQNKENYFAHLPEDYDPEESCKTQFPNRAIYSDKSSLEETKNNWLVYRPSAYHDFPKDSGSLVSLDSIENKQILARFENKSQIYNALTTVDVSVGPKAYLGNDRLFDAPPIDLSQTDIGYAGSQNQMLLRTEFGHIFVDAKRGQVILLKGNSIENLSSKGRSKWFAQNLPFKILNYAKDANIDNNFFGAGLHGVYDAFYKRFILTKIDYEPKEGVTANGSEFFFTTETQTLVVRLGDPDYFINKSWTVSYSFKTESWVSMHSYTPNFYIAHPTYFQSGINPTILDAEEIPFEDTLSKEYRCTIWNHNQTYEKFNNFYNTLYPFSIEYPFVYKIQDEILQNIKDYCTVLKYTSPEVYYQPDETIYFNKAVISNNAQCTGILNLVPKPIGRLSSYMSFPKYNTDSKDIIVTRSDNFYNFNTFWDIVKDTTQPFFSTGDFRITDKELDNNNLDYTKRSHKKGAIRAKDCKVRLTLDNRDDVKIITKFIINSSTPSYK